MGTLGLLPKPAGAAEPKSAAHEAIQAGWAKYDPAIRQAFLAKQAEKPPAAAASSAKPVAPATQPPTSDEATVVLPKMVVAAARENPIPLPRVHIPSPAKDLKGEPLESPGARTERLIAKHIAPLDKLLNTFRLKVGSGSLADRAKQMEAVESAAVQLNDIAALLELSLLAGTETLEEQKALRAELLKASYNRPRN